MENLTSILLFEFTEAPPRCPESLRVTFQTYLAGGLDRAALRASCTAALGPWTERAPAYLFRLIDQWRTRDRFDEIDQRILDCAVAVGPTQLNALLSFFNTAQFGAIRDYLLATYGETKEMVLCLFLELYRWREVALSYGPPLWGQTLLTFLPAQGALLLALIERQAWPSKPLLHLLKLLDHAGPAYRDLIPPLAERLWAAREQIEEYDLSWLVRLAPKRFAEWSTRFLTPLLSDGYRSYYQAHLLEALMDVDPARYIDYAVQAARLDLSNADHSSMPPLPGAGLRRAFRFDPARFLPLVETLLTSRRKAYRAFALGLLQRYNWAGKRACFLDLLGHERAEVRVGAAEWLAQRGEPSIPALARALSHQDARVRLHAACALEQIGTPAVLDILRQRLPVERAPAVRQKLTALVGPPAPVNPACIASAERQIAALCAVAEAEPRTARAFAWLDPAALPALRWSTGSPVPLPVIRYLLQCQAGMSTMALAPVVEDAVSLIDRAGDFALALVTCWAASRARLADMRALLLAAALGDDRMISPLCARNNQRSEQVKFEVACNEAWILARLGTDAALRAIGARCLFPARNILWTAFDALAARRLTTPEELFDVCGPDLGFSAQGEQVIAYGQRRLTARISPAWSAYDECYFRLFDEQGDRLSAFPRRQTNDDRRAYRQALQTWWGLRQDVRSSVEAHLRRLDAAITSRRTWSAARWRPIFLEPLIERIAAMCLVWEYQAAPEAPWTRFTVTAAGECLTSAGTPLDLEPAGMLRLAHPFEMEATALEQDRKTHPSWFILKYLWDHEWLGLQCWRPLTLLPEEERVAHWHDLARPFALEYHHLRENGWLPGSETNDEPFTTLWKPLPLANVTIVVQTRTPTTLHPGCSRDRVCRGELARLGFLPHAAVERENNAFRDLPQDDPRLLPLGTVPAIAFSDALYDIQRFRKLNV